METDPIWRATLCGTRKIPDPIIVPTTMAIAPRVPIARGSSAGPRHSAPEARDPGDGGLAGNGKRNSRFLMFPSVDFYKIRWAIILRGFPEVQTPFRASLAETPEPIMTNFIPGRFEGQVALVVGGAQGIGKAIAVRLVIADVGWPFPRRRSARRKEAFAPPFATCEKSLKWTALLPRSSASTGALMC